MDTTPDPMHPLHPHRLFVNVRMLLLGIPVALAGTGVLIVVPGLRRRRILARWTARTALRLAGFGIEVRGLDRLPRGACVVAATHASYLDGVILTAALPARFAFVIKSEMARVPVAGLLLRRLSSLFVNRAAPSAGHRDTRAILAAARAGEAIGIFPEGTFQRRPGLLPFRQGAFLIATRARLPVVPLIVEGSRTALPSGSWWLTPSRFRVRILPAVKPESQTRSAARELSDETRRRLLAAHSEPDLA